MTVAKRQGVSPLFERGRAHHLAGRLSEAETLYRQTLRYAPDHADCLHLLGVLLHQQGRAKPAVDWIQKALHNRPDAAHYLGSLGLVYHSLGLLEDAADCFRKAVALRPDFVDGHCKLGLILAALGRPAEAEICYREVLRLQPDLHDVLSNLGNALQAQGRIEEAQECYRAVLAKRPDFTLAWNNLGNSLRVQGQPDEAQSCYREALHREPRYAEAWCNLGAVLFDKRQSDEAETAYRSALALRPDFAEAVSGLTALQAEFGSFTPAERNGRRAVRLDPSLAEAHLNLGNAMREQGSPLEAAEHYRQAARLKPGLAEAHNNLGQAMTDLQRWNEAEDAYREAILLDPSSAEAHYNLAGLLLRTGRFTEGWDEYEWRWGLRNMGEREPVTAKPLWDGRPLEGRTLLLRAEQGLGDTLQFCRYVPAISAGESVILEVPAALERLMASLAGGPRVVRQGDLPPRFDVYCPLLSLPRLVGTRLETIPWSGPYLRGDAKAALVWRDRLAELPGRKVGLVWAGNPRLGLPVHMRTDARRSVALTHFAALARIEGVTLLSLQKGAAADQLRRRSAASHIHDFTDELNDFADTAALIEALDLVISVDTSAAHLAGALGKPVWLLNRFDSCWRWLTGRTDSPWYPTLRQFRQASPGDWGEVLWRVQQALEEAIQSDSFSIGA